MALVRAAGLPIGFNVDLARAICEELSVACTIQVRRFDTLLDALAEEREIPAGDVLAPFGSTTIFTFIWTWDDFFGPLIYLNDMNSYTIQLGLRTFRHWKKTGFSRRW